MDKKCNVKIVFLFLSIFFSSFFYNTLVSYYKPHTTGITFVIHGVDINLVQGDIVHQYDVDVMVNPANQYVKQGGGACSAILSVAGTPFEAACIRALNSFKERKASVGSVVLTDGCDLDPDIIHVVTPNFNSTNFVQKSLLFDDIGKNLLEKTYFNILSLAIDKGFKKIAMPFLSGGNFCRVPSDRGELAAIALESVLHFCKSKVKCGTLQEVRFVLYNTEDFELFAKELDNLVG